MADTLHLAVIVNDEINEESRHVKAGEDLLDGAGHRLPVIWPGIRAPTVSDDNTGAVPVKPGDFWVNTTTKKLYVCFSAATGAAAWQDMTVPPPFDPQTLVEEINSIQTQLSPRPGASYYSSVAAINSGGTPTIMPCNVTSNQDSEYYSRSDNAVTLLASMRVTIIVNITLYNTNKSASSMARYWIEISIDGGASWSEIAGTEGYITTVTKLMGSTSPSDITIPVQSGDMIRCRFQRVLGTSMLSTLASGCRLRFQSEGVEEGISA